MHQQLMFKSKNKKIMYTPVKHQFCNEKWGSSWVQGSKLHGHVCIMFHKNVCLKYLIMILL